MLFHSAKRSLTLCNTPEPNSENGASEGFLDATVQRATRSSRRHDTSFGEVPAHLTVMLGESSTTSLCDSRKPGSRDVPASGLNSKTLIRQLPTNGRAASEDTQML